jgi:WD40 repeat protein
MNHRQLFIAFAFFVFSLTHSFGQEIPIGTWRAHISYNAVYDITFGDNKVFASASNGVMAFDLSDKSVSNVNKVNGLSGSQITSIAFHEDEKTLLISYADGILDLIRDNEVTSFDRLKNSTTISGSKKLNAIHIHNGFAYIAADFGVVVFDVNRGEVKETWRDLGAGGATLQINEIAFRGDSIFLATAKGVMAGDQRDNLLDFNLWKRFDQAAFNAPIASVASFNGSIYAAINGSGIYRYENGTWTKESYLQNLNYQSLFASVTRLLIAQEGQLWQLNTSGQLEEIVSDKFVMDWRQREWASYKHERRFYFGDFEWSFYFDNI